MTSDSSKRPLSPHLQVYKPQMTSMTSILHRITGAGLGVGLLLVTWVLVAAAVGEGAYYTAMDFISSPLGILLMFGWTVALYYHLFNGIRHLIWDTGRLLSLKGAYTAGYIVLALTVIATAATWVEVYN